MCQYCRKFEELMVRTTVWSVWQYYKPYTLIQLDYRIRQYWVKHDPFNFRVKLMLAFDSWCQKTLGKTPNIKVLGVKPIFWIFGAVAWLQKRKWPITRKRKELELWNHAASDIIRLPYCKKKRTTLNKFTFNCGTVKPLYTVLLGRNEKCTV